LGLTISAYTQRQYLASKILDIGKSGLRSSMRPGVVEAPQIHDASKIHESIRWMQRAFALTERSDDSATSGMAELKVGHVTGIPIRLTQCALLAINP
jgi:hypothetical protein